MKGAKVCDQMLSPPPAPPAQTTGHGAGAQSILDGWEVPKSEWGPRADQPQGHTALPPFKAPQIPHVLPVTLLLPIERAADTPACSEKTPASE